MEVTAYMPRKRITESTTIKRISRKAKKERIKAIVFKIYAPQAHQIQLVADFNNWDICSLPMLKRDDGVWEITIALSAGEYQYKYLVDGKWENDIQEAMLPNPYGTMNNSIKIE
jgi:1,4-alpha-glucan branching enzyme